MLTYSPQHKAYRVWEMTNYGLLYSLPDQNVTEIKISPGTMLLIHTRQIDHVHLKIVSIEDGRVSKEVVAPAPIASCVSPWHIELPSPG